MIIIVIRTFVLSFIVLFSLRIMGKGELSKMDPFQMVILFMISELASLPIAEPDVSLIHGACAIVKGIRNGKDSEYEMWMAEYNREHAPTCDTLLLPADKSLAEVSSTAIKQMAKDGQDITALVTPMVAAALSK